MVALMEIGFTPVGNTKTLDELVARSHDAPVLLFKHSTTCPISAAAHRQMERVKSDISLIVVQRNRDVSREVEARTGVQHESPQALILRRGEVVWSASHFDITAEAVEQALGEHA